MSVEALDLKGRSVWQVVGSYGIAAWAVLQVADTLSSLVGLPLWFGQVLIVVLGVGFALILATSLVQRARAPERPARGLAAFLTWRNAARIGLAVLAVMCLATVGYLGLRSLGIGPIGTLQARGLLQEQDRLVLADMDGNVSDPALAETATTLLRIDLAQSQAFTVLEPAQLAPVLARMQRDPEEPLDYEAALEVARREGIKAIVTGDLLEAGSSIVVSARIVVASTGEALVAVRETAEGAASLPDAMDRVSARLRERIGESLRTIQGDPPLQEVTTASLEALEKYGQAERANNAGDVDRAIVLMREALGADSMFAMGHRKLGILMANRSGNSEESRRAFTRAQELRDRLTDRERWLAEAAYLTYVADDLDGATDRYVTLLESYPTDPIALNNLAIDYAARGRREDAVELYLRSVRQGGAPATTFSGLIPLLYELDRENEARAMLEEFERTHPGNREAARHRITLLSASFDYAGAEAAARQIREETRNTPEEGNALIDLAHAQLVRGKVELALEHFDEGLGVLERAGVSVGISRGVAAVLVGGSVRLNFQDDPAAAARFADESRRRLDTDADPPSDRQDLRLAALYAAAGRPDRARTLIAAYERSFGTDGGSLAEARGWLALAEGRVEEALDLMHEGREESPACALCGLSELGAAFDTAAQPDSAIHYLESYLSTRDLERLSSHDNLLFWSVVPRLGELHAEHGDPVRARELFQLFLDATQDADAPYQTKRDRVRARLEALAG